MKIVSIALLLSVTAIVGQTPPYKYKVTPSSCSAEQQRIGDCPSPKPDTGPTKPIVKREPVYKDTETCQKGWHLERWHDKRDYGSADGLYAIHQDQGYAPIDKAINIDPEDGKPPSHPDRCVKDAKPIILNKFPDGSVLEGRKP